MPKRGTVREDGMVFARMLRGKEIWLTKESYERRENTRKKYVRACADAYKERQVKKPIEDRNYLGRYDPYTDKYFLGVTSSGKEIWGSKQRLAHIRNSQNIRRKRFAQRCLKHNDPSMSVGEPHPTIKGLFVILRIGNKLYFGDKERLEQKIASRKRSYYKRDIKYRHKRKLLLKDMAHKHKRGDIRADGLIFWEYRLSMKEVWLTPEDFRVKHQATCERRRINRRNRKTKDVT